MLTTLKDVRAGWSVRVIAGIARGDWKTLTFDTPLKVNAIIRAVHPKWAASMARR